MSLIPPIDQLGSAAPYLGPWFEPDVLLAAPRDPTGIEPYDLSIPLAIPGPVPPAPPAPPTAFLPPAPGYTSLHVTTQPRPPAIARLLRPDGQPAFDDDRLVLLYTLLPEVEERLYRLLDETVVPPVDGVAPAAPTPQRARIRHLAIQFATRRVDELFALHLPGAPSVRADPSDPSSTEAVIDPQTLAGTVGWPNQDATGTALLAQLASYVGLALDGDGLTLGNGTSPIVDRHRPGYIPLIGDLPRILDIPLSPKPLTDSLGNPLNDDTTGSQKQVALRLYAFDDRGLPVDPGAVAAWWAQLAPLNLPTAPAGGHPDLWAPGLVLPPPAGGLGTDYRRTCGVAAASTVHFVDAHDLPLGGTLEQRLRDANETLQPISAVSDWPLFDASALTTPVAISTADPVASTATRLPLPMPRIAALPNGRHAAQLALWGTPGAGGRAFPARDFVRLTMVEVEQHLLGQSRVAPPGPAPADPVAAARHAAEMQRADDQARVTTRTRIAPSTGPALLPDADTATAAAIGVIAAATGADVVAGTLDPDWGALTWPLGAPVDLSSAQAWPGTLPTLVALRGGDPDPSPVSGSARGARVLLTLNGLPPGTWLRVWTSDFDLDRGSWRAGNGGAGLVNAAGVVSVVIELPHTVAPGAHTLLSAALSEPGGSTVRYAPVSLQVPGLAGGGSTGVMWSGGAVTVCEQGVVAQVIAAGTLRAGDTVVDVGAPGLVDPATIPLAQYAAAAAGNVGAVVANALTANDRVELTQPAFQRTPDGRVNAGAAVGPAAAPPAVVRTVRTPLLLMSDSQPLATQERFDQAAVDGAATTAAIWTAPALGTAHDLGRHAQGHPYAPAAVECAGTGVALNGLAADLVAEHTEDRIDRIAANLIQTRRIAATPATAPTPPAGATIWAGVLRTVAANVEGETAFRLGTVIPYRYGAAVHGISTLDVTIPPYPFAPVDPTAVPRPYTDVNGVYDATCLKDWYDGAVTDAVTPPVGVPITVFGTPLPASTGWSASRLAAAERAMDRRARAAGWGLREAVPALRAAFARARDFVWLETPALDLEALDPKGEKLVLLQTLIDRLQSEPQLRVFACVSALPPVAGWPKSLTEVWRDNLGRALAELKTAGGARVTAFAPSAGMGRPLRLSSTTVIVDDAWALTGSTHLSRRGLSFDSALAAVIWDEQLCDGRPADIVRFRRQLVSRRLSLPPNRVPDDPAALAAAIEHYAKQRSGRLHELTFPKPSYDPLKPGDRTMLDAANPDGGYRADTSLLDFITSLVIAVEGNTPLLNGNNGKP